MAKMIPRFMIQGKKADLESDFARRFMRMMRDLYGARLWETAIRGGLGARSGLPDRVLSIDGRFLAIEFKNPNGKGRLGPKQELELKKIRDSGAVAMVISSFDQIKEIIEKFPPTQRIIMQ